MTISSVSSNVNHTAAIHPQKQPAIAKEVENDKNNGGSAVAAQTAPRPSVNTSGQVVGKHVNTQA